MLLMLKWNYEYYWPSFCRRIFDFYSWYWNSFCFSYFQFICSEVSNIPKTRPPQSFCILRYYTVEWNSGRFFSEMTKYLFPVLEVSRLLWSAETTLVKKKMVCNACFKTFKPIPFLILNIKDFWRVKSKWQDITIMPNQGSIILNSFFKVCLILPDLAFEKCIFLIWYLN